MLSKEYLENGVEIYQDDKLYTFTSDSILLSKFAAVKKNEVMADFCSGSGIVGFNVYALQPEKIKSVTFFEMQKPLYDLSVKSISLNGFNDKFFAENVKLQDLPKTYYGKFSLIVCNPPYMKDGSGETNKDDLISVCKAEKTLPLKDLASALGKALKFGGRVALIHRADRLAEVVRALYENGIETKRLQLISSGDKPPYAFLLEGVKGGKPGVKLLNTVKN